VNTRIQVEHPVTEATSGVDLVRLQLEIAAGHPLEITQADVELRGHAIEARLYAEDPGRNFLPSIGRVQAFAPPQGPGIRNDVGVQAGDSITMHYDPMIAKLIIHAETRSLSTHAPPGRPRALRVRGSNDESLVFAMGSAPS